MTVLEDLEELEGLYAKFREYFYKTQDHPDSQDEFFGREPEIPRNLFVEIRDLLIALNDDLSSAKITELIEHMAEDSSLDKYVMFNMEDWQLDYIQDQSDAFDERLGEIQQQAANGAFEEKNRLWDEAHEEAHYLIEELFPVLF